MLLYTTRSRKCIIYIEDQNTRKALASNIFWRPQSYTLITEERCIECNKMFIMLFIFLCNKI